MNEAANSISPSAKHPCPRCKGTGRDEAKTKAFQSIGKIDSRSYVRCWDCNGNGLDPAAYFNWSK